MENRRKIKQIWKSKPTVEGAGVHLNRVFGNEHSPQLDPFLLLDDFHSLQPELYRLGFPWHPHRGIETITYMLEGTVEHSDSLGNKGVIYPGEVQWMTAGSGIVHQEMPHGEIDGKMWGLQLWANLPATHKMMQPRYRDVKKMDIPVMELENGVLLRIIAGKYNGTTGPVKDVIIEPEYFDITIPSNQSFQHSVKKNNTVFAYILDGDGRFDKEQNWISRQNVVIFDQGEQVSIQAGANGIRFLLISGKPLKEPIAWYGPIVMNTRKELQIAFEEYQNGTFLKHKI